VKVAFHSSYLGYRGTEIALMDYARGNQEVLRNESFFLMPWREGGAEHPVTLRMKEIAPLRFYRSAEEREKILREESADFLYCIKNGFNDGVFSTKVPTGIHAIFRESEFHGDIYAYVSPWLSDVMSYGKAPWVPHMVSLSDEDGDMRTQDGGRRTEDGGRRAEAGGRKSVVGDLWSELKIPKEATVFGRHGGYDSFDIPWVQEAVIEAARKNPNIWFLFLNTESFGEAAMFPNICFLPATADPILKKKFLNTCDAMLHGRERGETFGLSCLEFAQTGKPILSYLKSPEKAHFDILGSRIWAYENKNDLQELLIKPWSFMPKMNIVKRRDGIQTSGLSSPRNQKNENSNEKEKRKPYSVDKKDSFCSLQDYQPSAVMQRFQEVFLNQSCTT